MQILISLKKFVGLLIIAGLIGAGTHKFWDLIWKAIL